VDWLHRRAEIGYWLGREFQGHGMVTDACRAVTRHALVELGLNRVEIRCATGNAKSKAIPLRLGFTLEGVLRQAELEVYSMLRSDFA
jgi:ribosomal-protein-serine acetyltransferase